MVRRPPAPLLGALVFLLLGCAATPAGEGGSPTPDASVGSPASAPGSVLAPDTVIPLPQSRADGGSIAATGAALVRSVVVPYTVGYEFSVDKGGTWQPVPAEIVTPSGLVGAGGRFAAPMLEEMEEGGDQFFVLHGFQVWDPADGSVRTLRAELGRGGASEIADFAGSTVVFSDGRVFDVGGTAPVLKPIKYRIPAAAEDALRDYRLNDAGTAVVLELLVNKGRSSQYGYVAVAPLNGTVPAPVKVAGLLGVDVAGTTIHTLIGTSSALKACRSALAAPGSRTCATVRSADSRGYAATLAASAGKVLVNGPLFVSGLSRLWLVSGSTVTRPSAPSSTTEWAWLAYRDPQRPLITAQHRSLGSVTDVVTGATSVARLYAQPLRPTKVDSLAVSPGRVYAVDDRPYMSKQDGDSEAPNEWVSASTRFPYRNFDGPQRFWSRRVMAGQVGAEVALGQPPRGLIGVDASAGRATLASRGGDNVSRGIYDLGVLKSKATGSVWALSGPYTLGGAGVRRVDGVSYPVEGSALFGSLVARLTDDGTDPEGRVSVLVQDVARPGSDTLTVDFPREESRNYSGPQLWGDWLGISSWGMEAAPGAMVKNLRTGEVLDHEGELFALGDGFALLRPEGGVGYAGVKVWTFADGVTIDVPDSLMVATDGNATVAWVKDGAINMASIPGAGQSAPRLLGAITKASLFANGSNRWTPQFDLTKAINAGTIEIRDAAGTVVRSISTGAAERGSLRTASWDGRNAAGSLVKAGSYTWALVVTATDGTGPAGDLGGVAEPIGTIKVSR